MHLDKLNQWLMLAANIGVLAGIVFVGLEIQQNNDAIELQVQSENRQRTGDLVELVINNPELTELMALEDSELTEAERNRLHALAVRAFINSDELYSDMLDGRVSHEETVRRLRAVWRRAAFNYYMPQSWEVYKPRASDDFIEFFETWIIPEELPTR